MNNRGFSLVEVIGAVVLIGIISMGAVSIIGNMNKEARIATAVGNAHAVNAAKQAFRNRVPSADTVFVGDDATKFEILRAGRYLPYAPSYTSTNPRYMPEGYQLIVGDLVTSASIVTVPGGKSVFPTRDPSL